MNLNLKSIYYSVLDYFLQDYCQPLSPCFIFSFFSNNFTEKTVDIGGILTQINRIQGKPIDHLTIALFSTCMYIC